MKEFIKDGKVNFCDSNDVLIGFSNEQNCCESFGWFYSKDIPTLPNIDKDQMSDPKLKNYLFDTSFFLQQDSDNKNCATFKLINARSKNKTIYLTIFNHHDGYYSHGFKVQVGGKVIQEGAL